MNCLQSLEFVDNELHNLIDFFICMLSSILFILKSFISMENKLLNFVLILLLREHGEMIYVAIDDF